MALFNKKYRVEETRLKNWDYRSSALYFITICTKNRKSFFGKIRDEEMILNGIGTIARNEWEKTPFVRPDMNLMLDEFAVMPNHFHAIIGIGENEFNSASDNVADNKFGPQSKTLGSIVRGFKTSVTIKGREIIPGFSWQERFHDHIIRDEESYSRIKHYILSNPANWEKDTFYLADDAT